MKSIVAALDLQIKGKIASMINAKHETCVADSLERNWKQMFMLFVHFNSPELLPSEYIKYITLSIIV